MLERSYTLTLSLHINESLYIKEFEEKLARIGTAPNIQYVKSPKWYGPFIVKNTYHIRRDVSRMILILSGHIELG